MNRIILIVMLLFVSSSCTLPSLPPIDNETCKVIVRPNNLPPIHKCIMDDVVCYTTVAGGLSCLTKTRL